MNKRFEIPSPSPTSIVLFIHVMPGITDIHNRLGLIPHMLDPTDPDRAAAQFHKNYQHGGGWRPIKGFALDPKTLAIVYPGDPPYRPLALIHLRDEVILFYPCALVLVYQTKDKTFELARMD